MNQSFGSLFKSLRQELGYTLRAFCTTHDFDAGNISKIERGKATPPVDVELIKKYARALQLKEGSDQWNQFMILAATTSHRIPQPVLDNQALLDRLPILFRTLTGEKVSPEKLDLLINMLKDE